MQRKLLEGEVNLGGGEGGSRQQGKIGDHWNHRAACVTQNWEFTKGAKRGRTGKSPKRMSGEEREGLRKVLPLYKKKRGGTTEKEETTSVSKAKGEDHRVIWKKGRKGSPFKTNMLLLAQKVTKIGPQLGAYRRKIKQTEVHKKAKEAISVVRTDRPNIVK